MKIFFYFSDIFFVVNINNCRLCKRRQGFMQAWNYNICFRIFGKIGKSEMCAVSGIKNQRNRGGDTTDISLISRTCYNNSRRIFVLLKCGINCILCYFFVKTVYFVIFRLNVYRVKFIKQTGVVYTLVAVSCNYYSIIFVCNCKNGWKYADCTAVYKQKWFLGSINFWEFVFYL